MACHGNGWAYPVSASSRLPVVVVDATQVVHAGCIDQSNHQRPKAAAAFSNQVYMEEILQNPRGISKSRCSQFKNGLVGRA
jgi:hypothetical protein